jgi:hypothetical protein
MDINKKQLKKLISKDKLDEAIDILIEHYDDDVNLNYIILLSNRLNSLVLRERKGIISFEDASLEKNKITNSLISIIDDNFNYEEIELSEYNFEKLEMILKKHVLDISFFDKELKKVLLDFSLILGDENFNLFHQLLIWKERIHGKMILSKPPKDDMGGQLMWDSFNLLRDFGIINLDPEIGTYKRWTGEYIKKEFYILPRSEEDKVYENYTAPTGNFIAAFSDRGKRFISYFFIKHDEIVVKIQKEQRKISEWMS